MSIELIRLQDLTLCSEKTAWETRIDFKTRSVTVSISTDGTAPTEERLQAINDDLRKFESLDRSARLYAARRKTELKNTSWLEPGDDPVWPEEFADRIRLEEISFQADGEVTLDYHDDDLFWGHGILVVRNTGGRWCDCLIWG